ncbi:MAG: putative transporter ATP-binding protein [Herbinix sp.]|jgi:simple sugar transport system ATP-binding protein|nr:putative transporter ATP-binding protein [Herbinix sp.]
MNSEPILLEMQHITKKYSEAVVALNNVKFQLKSGEIHALLGENGAGKSTLIKVLTGVEKRNSGSIQFDGKEINPTTVQEAQNLGISTVYQEVNLCPNLSVAENIYIGREPKKRGHIDWNMINANAKKLLERFNLDLNVTKRLDTYSVAIQQMVAIARASDISAKVLILDEPTSSLSKVEVEKLFDTMRLLKSQGMGIIFVTHFLDQVYEITDMITVLRNGEYVGTYETANLSRVELVGKMIGKEYSQINEIQHTGKNIESEGELFANLQGVSGFGTVQSMDLSIRYGEVLGLSGLLGSGRSEIARLLFGIDKIEQGDMEIKGKKSSLKSTLDAIKEGIAFCPEDRKTDGIVGDLSVRENIILALQAKKGLLNRISRQEAEVIADHYIEKLEIKTPTSEQIVKNLSGGNQQKVILARWLATNPELLILDEPTRGIDIGTKAEIQKIVTDLARQGMAVIFISSEIDEMLRCCSRIAILRDMKKIAEVSGTEISEETIMHYIAGGERDEKA